MTLKKDIYQFDTVATLFPAVTAKDNSSIFRISAILKEDVNNEILQKALERIFPRYPMFALKVEKTNFSEHFIKNDKLVIVKKECDYPCDVIIPEENNDYLFQVLYYNKRISIEVNHSLTDGTGAFSFLKTLLYQYLLYLDKPIVADSNIIVPDEKPIDEEMEDSFKKYYKEESKSEIPKVVDAFKIRGTVYKPYGNNLTIGVVKTDSLKKLSKEKGVTITQYMCALLTYSIYKTKVNPNVDTSPIIIAVPVNLRSYFPTATLKNFFCVVNISIDIDECSSLDNIIKKVKDEFKSKTTKEYMHISMASNQSVMENFIVKKSPRFIRNAGTKFVYAFFIENLKTITLSNVGEVKLPPSMIEYVDRFESSIYPTKGSPINCCVCSFNNKFSISFIRSITDNSVLNHFFTYLSKHGCNDTEIYSNEWGIADDIL